jgi:hypothetical protein
VAARLGPRPRSPLSPCRMSFRGAAPISSPRSWRRRGVLRRSSPSSPPASAVSASGSIHYGPWFIAIGVWFALWELTTAKFGWLPKPFFSPPNGLLNVYVTEAPRLLICIGYTLRLWSGVLLRRVTVGYALGVALGWSKRFSYWGMPILKLIGPVPATAWIPCTFFSFRPPSPRASSSSRWRRAFRSRFSLPPASPRSIAPTTTSGAISARANGISCRRSPCPRRCRMSSSACSWGSTIRSPCSSWRKCSGRNSGSAGTSSSRPPIPATPTSTRRW